MRWQYVRHIRPVDHHPLLAHVTPEIGLGGIKKLCFPGRAAYAYVAAGAGLLLTYFVIGAAFFLWYLALPITAAALVVAIACSSYRHGWAIAALVAALSWTTTYPLRRWEYQYRDLSHLGSVLPNSGTIMMDAVGVIGWQKPDVRFVDWIGLVAPQVEAERRKGDGWLGRVLRKERPDCVVMLERDIISNQPSQGAGKLFLETDKIPPYKKFGRSSIGHVLLKLTEAP
jgi:hypothetical protein